jgi:hypothetical protein
MLVLAVAAEAPGQAQDPCGLLTPAEIQSIAPRSKVGPGVARTGVAGPSCRYELTVGAGADTRKYTLDVTVSDAARLYAGSAPAQWKGRFQAMIREADPTAITISKVGDAALFGSASPERATASALVKDRVLQIFVQGPNARGQRTQIIEALKASVTRLQG